MPHQAFDAIINPHGDAPSYAASITPIVRPNQDLPQPPLGTWGPGFPYPDQGLPGEQPGIWGPNDPRPDHPIVLPPDTPVPPSWIGTLPPPGQPGSPGNPYPPGEVPDHPSTGLNTFYMVIPYVGVVGPFMIPPGAGRTPAVSP